MIIIVVVLLITRTMITITVIESGWVPVFFLPRDPKHVKTRGLTAVVGDFVLPWSLVVSRGLPWYPGVSRGLPWSPVVSPGLPWSPLVSHLAPVGRRGLPLCGSISNNDNKHNKNK